MRVLVFGGDKRYEEVVNYLKKANYDVDVSLDIEKINPSIYDGIILPVLGIDDGYKVGSEFLGKDFFVDTKEQVKIFSGIKTKALNSMLTMANRECLYLMQESDVVRQNIVPTVEGILADIIDNTDVTIHDSNIMVIGYGNVGKYLVNVLDNLKANVHIGINQEDDYNHLMSDGKKVFFTNDSLMNAYLRISDIIINTAPSLVLRKEHIPYINDNAYILDIASKPYGIDQDAFNKNNVDFKIYSSIPSKVAPKTAGMILARKIKSKLGG